VLTTTDVDALVHEHRGWLLRLCERRLGGDRHLAEDVVQDTFVKLSRALERGQSITNVKAWLRTVAQNGTVDELRKSRSVLVGDLPEPAVDASFAADGDPELELAWNGLSSRHREVLRLREVEGLRYDEIAHAMATGVPAVETLLFRARAALRREYSRAAAAVTTAPAQVAVGPLRPWRWSELWQSSADVVQGVSLRVTEAYVRAQLAVDAIVQRAGELAAGAALVGGLAAGLLPAPPMTVPAITPPSVPATVPALPATTVPTVPPAPPAPATTVPAVPEAPAAPPAHPLGEAVDEQVDGVAGTVDTVVDGVLEEILDLTASFG